MFVKVIFHGVLKKLCPGEYRVEAETPAEAIRGVTNQLRDKLVRKDGTMFQAVCKQCLNKFAFFSHIPESEEDFELDLFPAFTPSGGGNANVQNIIIGALIIVLTIVAIFLFGPAGAFASWAAFTEAAGLMGMTALASGTLLILQGTIGLLMQKKEDTVSDSTESSRTFGTNSNTTKIGTRIPIGYGKYKVYGHYLSVNTQALDRRV